VRVQRELFVAARQAEESYTEKQEYLRLLTLGAEETTAVHSGLVEGKHFYEVVLTELRKACEGAANVADAREGERRQLQRRLAETTSPPPPPYSAAAPSAAAPSAAASCAAASAADGALNALEQARSAWFQRATNACNSGGHAAPAAAPYELPCATAFPAPASTPVTPVAVPIPCRPAPAQQPATPPAIATAAATPPPISMIGCYNCRKQFGVPPNTSIVACPFCATHNRVPT